MPTVSNHDVLGPMPWGGVGNSRHFGGRDRDRSDARGGINSLLFEEPVGGGRRTCSVPDEHAYASGAFGAAQNFVSQSGYYGYQQTSAQAGEGQDCSMDTSENNLPDHAFGVHPNAGFGAPALAVPAAAPHVWHADQINMNQIQTRKRNLDARGCGRPDGPDGPDHDLLERPAVKRTKSCPSDEGVAGASTQAMVQGFGVPSSMSNPAELSHPPAQMYDIPVQPLPRSTSLMADAMTPRPRCLMGHFI